MSLKSKPLLLLMNRCVSHHHACTEGWSSLCLRHPGWFDFDSSRGSSGIESQQYLGSHCPHLHKAATTTEHFFMGELQNHTSLPAYYSHPFNAQCSLSVSLLHFKHTDAYSLISSHHALAVANCSSGSSPG